MPNLAVTLKEEIRRLARKEIKAQSGSTRQVIARYRREIAQLKRQLREQEKRITSLAAQNESRLVIGDDEEGDQVRFSPQWVKSQRKRLGFSAAEYARLVGVSTLSVYNWENGRNRPRQSQLEALAAIRGIGKREAIAKLAELDEEE